MKDFTIIIENNEQKSKLELITSNDQRVIEEVTTYLENGRIFKCSLQRDEFYADMTLEALTIFFNSQLNALIEFYRVKGEFKIQIK